MARMKNMNHTALLAIVLLAVSAPAFALPEQPSPAVVDPSPVLQIAHRVASMENEKDLPSRAVWLGKKAALNTRLASSAKIERKTRKKHVN